MKHLTRLVIFLAICTAPLCALRAQPLTKETPVYAAPDASAPILVTLPAGAEPSPATATSAVALPEGWHAIAINASLDVWVRDSDLNKELDVKPGSSLRAQPNPDSTEMGTMVAGDVAELRGIQGKWVQMHLTRKATGYINTAASATAPAPAAIAAPITTTTTVVETQPDANANAYTTTNTSAQGSSVPYAANQTAAPAVQQPLSVSMQSGGRLPANAQTQQPQQQQSQPRNYNTTTTTTTVTSNAPVSTGAYAPSTATTTTVTTSQPATATSSIGQGRTYEARPASTTAASVPRTFEGTFASTRRAFMPRRPYDFQLTATDGTRLVYVDLSKLTVTEQFETYIGRTVTVMGPIAAVPGTNDIVVKAETLQVK